MLERIAVFRRLVKLNDGQSVLLRPLVSEDKENLVDLFRTSTTGDRRFLKHDITDEDLVRSWTDEIDYSRVLPIVAEAGGRIIGEATLHFGKLSTRHVGEVRIYLEPPSRGKGLGTIMLKEIIALGRQAGLVYLLAQIVLDQTEVIKAFQNLGFKMEATIRDYFLSEDGQSHNVVILLLPLQRESRYEF